MSILMMAKILTNLSLYYAFLSMFRGNASLLPVFLSIVCCMAGIGVATRAGGGDNTGTSGTAGLAGVTGSADTAGSSGAAGSTATAGSAGTATAGTGKSGGFPLPPVLLKLIAFLLLVLPLLYLRAIAHSKISTVIMCLIPAFYCAVLILIKNLRVEYARFESHLKGSALLYLFLFAISALWSGSWQTSAVFTVLYLYTGTWLLRQLRLQEGSDTRVRVLDALISGGILLAVYLAGGLILFAFGYAKNFLHYLWIPFEAIIYAVAWVFCFLMSLFPNDAFEMPDNPFTQETQSACEQIVEDETAVQSYEWLRILLILIAAAAIITIIVKLILKYKQRDEAEAIEEKSIRREKIEHTRERRRLFGGDSRTSVRKLYRKYLMRLKDNGMEMYPGMTTEDVQQTAESIRRAAASDQSETSPAKNAQNSPETNDPISPAKNVQNSPVKKAQFSLAKGAQTENTDSFIRSIYMQIRYRQDYMPDEQELTRMKELTRQN